MAETLLVPGKAVNPQLREWMQDQGIDPNKYTVRSRDDMTDEELEELYRLKAQHAIQAEGGYTSLESGLRHARQGVAPMAAGLAAGTAATPWFSFMGPYAPLGGIAVGAVTAAGAAWGQDKIVEAVLDDEAEAEYHVRNEVSAATNPNAALAGSLAVSLPFFRPSGTHIRNLGSALKNLPHSQVVGRAGTKLTVPQMQALKVSAAQGAIDTTVYGGMHLGQTGEMPSVGDLAKVAVFGSLTTTPTGLTRKLFPHITPGVETWTPAELSAYQSGAAKHVVAASYKQAVDEFNAGKHQETEADFLAFDTMAKEAGGGEQGQRAAAQEWINRRTKVLFEAGVSEAGVDAHLEPVFEGVHGGSGKASEIPATSVGVTVRGGIEMESPVAQAIKNTADESSGGLYSTETVRPVDFGYAEAKAAAAVARDALKGAEAINAGRKPGSRQVEALQQEFRKGVKKKYTKKELADQRTRAEKLEKAVEDFGITYKGGEATWKHGGVEYEIRYTKEVPVSLKTTSTAGEFLTLTGLNKRALLTQAKRGVGNYRILEGVITDKDGNPIVAGSKSEHVPLREVHEAYREARGRAAESLYEGKPMSAEDVAFTKIHGAEVSKKDPVGKPVRRVVRGPKGRAKVDEQGRVEWEEVQPTRARKVTELPAAAGWRPEPRGGEVPAKYDSEYVVTLKAGDSVSHMVKITDSEGRPTLLDNSHVVTKVDDTGFTVRNIGTRGESKIPWSKFGETWFSEVPPEMQASTVARRVDQETQLTEQHGAVQTRQQQDYTKNVLEPLLFSRRLEYKEGKVSQVGARISDAEVEGIYAKIKELWPTIGTGKEAPIPGAVHDFLNLYVNHKYVRRFQAAEGSGKLKPMDTEVRDFLTHMARVRGYEVEKMLDVIDPSTGGFVRGEMLWDARIVRFDLSRATDDTIAHEFLHGFQLDLAASTNKKDRWLAKKLEEDIGPEVGAKREAFVEESGLEFVQRYRDSQDAGMIDRFISYAKDVKSVLRTRFGGKLTSADLRRILTLKAETDAPFLTNREMLEGVATKLGIPAEDVNFRIKAGLPVKASDAAERFQADPIDRVIKQVQGQLPLRHYEDTEGGRQAAEFRREADAAGQEAPRFPYDTGQKELLYKEGELTRADVDAAAEAPQTAGDRARAGKAEADRVAHGYRRHQPELDPRITALDESYMAAVMSLDKQQSRALLDRAAKLGGFQRGYHGKRGKEAFYVLDPEKIGYGAGHPEEVGLVHVTRDPMVAKQVAHEEHSSTHLTGKQYKERPLTLGTDVLNLYFKAERPLVFQEDAYKWGIPQIVQLLRRDTRRLRQEHGEGLVEVAEKTALANELTRSLLDTSADTKTPQSLPRYPVNAEQQEAVLGKTMYSGRVGDKGLYGGITLRRLKPGDLAYEMSKTERVAAVKSILNKHGYDSILYRNEGELSKLKSKWANDSYILFEPNQVKSADTYTHKDGEIIPLSKRFDLTSDDLRYQPEIRGVQPRTETDLRVQEAARSQRLGQTKEPRGDFSELLAQQMAREEYPSMGAVTPAAKGFRHQAELEGLAPRDIEAEFSTLRDATERSDPHKFLIENAEAFYAAGKPTDLWVAKHMAATTDKLLSTEVIGEFPSRSAQEQAVVGRQVYQNRFRDEKRFIGEFGEPFTQKISKINLSKADRQLISEYLYMLRNAHGKKITMDVDKRLRNKVESDPRLLHIVNVFREPMVATRVRHATEGPRIKHADGSWSRPSEKGDPYYWPEMLDSKPRRILTNKPNSKEAGVIREEILSHWRLKDPAASEETLIADFDDYISIMANQSTADPSTGAKFKALRSSEGRGLPYKHTDKDPTRTVGRYINRFAKDMAFHKNMEADPVARAIFRLSDDTGMVKPDSVTEFFGPEAVNPYTTRGDQLTAPAKDVINKLEDAALGFYTEGELAIATLNRLVVAGWIGGPVAGMRDMGSSVIQAFKFLPPAEVVKLLSGYKNFREGWIESHRQGVNRTRSSQHEHAQDTMNLVLDTVNNISDGVVKWSGRELFEKTSRTILFNAGKLAAHSMANKTNPKPHETRMLNELGRWASVDWKGQLRGKAGDVDQEALNKMGAAFVELVQGTYDARGVPVSTFKGKAAPFLSLSRWSIERFNRYNTHVIRPIQQNKDYRPLLYTTLGAFVGGEIINELAKVINGTATKNPDMYEVWDSGSTEDMLYHAMYVVNLSGYFGIASSAAHYAFRAYGPYKHRGPEGIPGVVFPLYEILWGGDNSFKNELLKLQMADYEDSKELTQAVLYFIGDQIRNYSQASRVFYNQVLASDTEMELRNMKRDFATFKHLHGYKDSSGGDYNWYENAPRYKLLASNTEEEIAENVGPAVDRAWRNAQRKGWFDKDSFKSSLASLYRTQSSQLKPSLRKPEDVPENVAFLDFIGRTKSPEAVAQVLKASGRQDELAVLREAAVKRYIISLANRQ